MNIVIRNVRQGDEKALAYIQTESWKAAFGSIVPPDLLKKYTNLSQAENMYAGLLQKNLGNGYILELDGQPHCIAYWDASRETDLPDYAELICIHSLQPGWHHGYGSQVMNRVLTDIKKAGYTQVMLWVFEENTNAIRFYKKHGFLPNEKRQEAFGAIEVMYERAL